jgi:hypothetical protein
VGRDSERAKVTSKAVAFEAVRQDLLAMHRTADVIDDDVPGFADQFPLPARKSIQEYLDAARAYRQHAAPVAARFIEHDMPEDFLQDLDQDIAQLDTAMREQESTRHARVAADVAFDEAMADAMQHIKRLDVCLQNKLKTNTQLRRVWDDARRVEYPPRRRRSAAEVDAPAAEA